MDVEQALTAAGIETKEKWLWYNIHAVQRRRMCAEEKIVRGKSARWHSNKIEGRQVVEGEDGSGGEPVLGRGSLHV